MLGAAVVFWWQRSQIVGLSGQLNRQDQALARQQDRIDELVSGSETHPHASGVRGGGWSSPALRADERQLILEQYRDVLAQMNLPPETATRLKNLLTDRIAAVLDAEDAAVQAGFAEGSAQTVRAVSLAVAESDREMAALVGAEGLRRLDGWSGPAQPAIATATVAPAAVNVFVSNNAPIGGYADTSEVAPADAYPSDYAAAPYYSSGWYGPVVYPYYGVAYGRGGAIRGSRALGAGRPGSGRSFPPAAGGRVSRSGGRAR